jgi:hypothetical protein
MKKEIAILGVAGLVLLLISMPYASATTTINGPFIPGEVPPLQPATSLPENSPFVVTVTTDVLAVESAHINVTFPLGPPGLILDTVRPDPLVSYDFSRYQDGTAGTNGEGTGWVDVIAAEAPDLPTGYPDAPLLAEIGFVTTDAGTYTIDLTSTINGVVDDVVPLVVTVIAVPGDVDDNGIVNYWDIVEVIEHWGMDPLVDCPRCDVDRDGAIGYSDISFIVAHM